MFADGALCHRQQLDDEHDTGDGQGEQEQDDGEDCCGSHLAFDDTAPFRVSGARTEPALVKSVQFLTRRVCRICAEALPIVAGRVERKGWALEIVDVDDSDLGEQFGDRVPVVLVDGVEVLSGRFGRREVRRALR